MGRQLFSSSHWFILTTKELFYNLFIALTGTYQRIPQVILHCNLHSLGYHGLEALGLQGVHQRDG